MRIDICGGKSYRASDLFPFNNRSRNGVVSSQQFLSDRKIPRADCFPNASAADAKPVHLDSLDPFDRETVLFPELVQERQVSRSPFPELPVFSDADLGNAIAGSSSD